MMTKKEFAECIIQRFCKSEGVDRSEASNYINVSSKLAVALEFLGELNEDEKEYASSRAGCEYFLPNNGEAAILTIREIIDILPDER